MKSLRLNEGEIQLSDKHIIS